jgi:hypothetical protein
VLLLLPFALVDVPPVLDYPNHLARMFVLAHPGDPILSRFYAPHWAVLPNLGFDVIGVVLLKVLPVHVSGRVLLAMSLLAPPLGVMAYSRAAFGRITGWALASSVAAFNGVFFLGFMNFLLSLGLGFAAAGLWLVLRRRGWTAAVIAGALSAALLFFCHIFGVLLFALLIGCAELENLWRTRKALNGSEIVRAAAALVVTLAPALILYRLSPLSGASDAYGQWEYWRKGWELFTPFMSYSKPLTLLTGALLFGFLIMSLRGARFAPGAKLALAVLALLFLAAPDNFKGGTFLDVRLALMLGLLLFAGIAPAPRWVLGAGIALVALVALRSLSVAMVWNQHNHDLADLRAAIAQVPAGAKVLALQGPQGDAADRLIPDLYRLDSHLPALLLIERRAFWPLLFADASQQPLIVRPPYDRIAQPLGGDTADWALLQQPLSAATLAKTPYLKNWRGDFDDVLLIDPPEPIAPVPGLVPLYAGRYARLWRITRQDLP